MRAPLLTLVALLLMLSSLALGEAPVRVHLRVEGAWAQVWEGDVVLPDTYTFVARNSGAAYTLPGHTPLAALVLGARAAGLDLAVSDEYSDFVVRSVAGEAWYDTRWWDYRVDWVEPNYGAQQQWLSWGEPVHPLVDGAEVLWYVDQLGTSPLHLAPLASVPGPACAGAALVQGLAVDALHAQGRPWPPVVWRPASLARLDGVLQGPVIAGVGGGVASGPGAYWADEQPLPGNPPVHAIRSERAALAC